MVISKKTKFAQPALINAPLVLTLLLARPVNPEFKIEALFYLVIVMKDFMKMIMVIAKPVTKNARPVQKQVVVKLANQDKMLV